MAPVLHGLPSRGVWLACPADPGRFPFSTVCRQRQRPSVTERSKVLYISLIPTEASMQQPVWARVRKDVGFQPLTEGRIGGQCPLYVERWVYQATAVRVAGIACPVLLTHLGGARVREGDANRWRLTSLPSQSILIPPNTPTRASCHVWPPSCSSRRSAS